MTTQAERVAALNAVEAEVNRGNDNGYAGNDTVFVVRALVEVGRILAGIEGQLEIANERAAERSVRL